MWIESLEISGLKSYGESPSILTFSKGLNAIVGSNGSGKSNILWAIDLLFQPHSMTSKERQSVLHQRGVHSKKKNISGYVLMTLNNSSHGFPFSMEKVNIKRVIGLKSDSFFVNSLLYSREDYRNLIENSLNHFFIRQGEVCKFALMSSKQRLQAIQISCGIDHFNYIWGLINQRMNHIIKSSELIDEEFFEFDKLLLECENEIRALNKNKDIVKRIDALSYIINAKNLESYKGKVRAITDQISEQMKENRYTNCLEKLKAYEEDLQSLCRQQNIFQEDIVTLNQDFNNNLSHYERLKCELSDLEKELSRENPQKTTIKLNELQKSKKNLEERLNELEMRLEKQQERVNEDMTDFEVHQGIQDEGVNIMKSNTHNKEEWSRLEMEKLSKCIQEKEGLIIIHEKEVEKTKGNIKDLQEKRRILLEDLSAIKTQTSNLQNEYHELSREHTVVLRQLNNRRKVLIDLKDDFRVCEERLKSRKRMRSLMMGIESMKNLYEELVESQSGLLDGFYGLLIDCIDDLEDIGESVSAVAGTKLFYHVVSHQYIASKLIELFNERNYRGEIFFLPLENLTGSVKIKDNEYDSMSACPLLAKLRFSPDKVTPAMKYVFGKWLLVKNIDSMHNYFHRRINVVTLQGDIFNCNGVMTGGYRRLGHDNATLYLEIVKKSEYICETEDEIWGLEANSHKLQSKMNAFCKDIEKSTFSNISGDIKHDQIMSDWKVIDIEIQYSKEYLDKISEALIRTRIDLEKYSRQKKLYLDRTSVLISKMKSPSFNKNLKLKQTKYVESHAELRKIIQEKKDLECKVHFCLRAEGDLISKLYNETQVQELIQEKSKGMEGLKEYLYRTKRDKSKISKDLEELDNQISDKKRIIKTKSDILSTLNEENGIMDALLYKKRHYESEISKLQDQTQCFEGNSNKYFSYYKGLNLSHCLRRIRAIKKVQRELSSSTNFCTAYEVQECMDKVNGMKDKFSEMSFGTCQQIDLIEILDSSRREIIDYTVEEVEKYFGNVFRFLAGYNCEGKIRIGRDPEGIIQELDVLVSFLRGAQLSVSNIDHLSLGQKTVVALSFIFSMQNCNPPGLYIMDEVDAALDSDTRRNLSMWLNRHILNRNSTRQVILTTFRKELLEHADQCIRVQDNNGISQMQNISLDEAMNFVSESPSQ